MLSGHNKVAPIAKRLKIEDEAVLSALLVLEDLEIAKRQEGGWRLTAKTIHAADESIFSAHHHRNSREKAVTLLRSRNAKNFHYTSVYCIDEPTLSKIRQELIDVAEESRRIDLPSDETTIACMNIDWFEL